MLANTYVGNQDDSKAAAAAASIACSTHHEYDSKSAASAASIVNVIETRVSHSCRFRRDIPAQSVSLAPVTVRVVVPV